MMLERPDVHKFEGQVQFLILYFITMKMQAKSLPINKMLHLLSVSYLNLMQQKLLLRLNTKAALQIIYIIDVTSGINVVFAINSYHLLLLYLLQ